MYWNHCGLFGLSHFLRLYLRNFLSSYSLSFRQAFEIFLIDKVCLSADKIKVNVIALCPRPCYSLQLCPLPFLVANIISHFSFGEWQIQECYRKSTGTGILTYLPEFLCQYCWTKPLVWILVNFYKMQIFIKIHWIFIKSKLSVVNSEYTASVAGSREQLILHLLKLPF